MACTRRVGACKGNLHSEVITVSAEQRNEMVARSACLALLVFNQASLSLWVGTWATMHPE